MSQDRIIRRLATIGRRRARKMLAGLGAAIGYALGRRVLVVQPSYVSLCLSNKEPLARQFGLRLWHAKEIRIDEELLKTYCVRSLDATREFPTEDLAYWVSLEINLDRDDTLRDAERRSDSFQQWEQAIGGLIGDLKQTLAKYRPRGVIYLQGHLPAAYAARRAAAELGLATLAIEKTFNNRLIIWSLVSGISVNQHEFALLYKKWRYTIDRQEAARWVAECGRDHKNGKFKDHATPAEAFVKDNGDSRPIILFLGQVHNDSSAHYGLPKAFDSQARLIQVLGEICQQNGWQLAVKFHPKESLGASPLGKVPLNQATARKAMRLLGYDDPPAAWDIDNRFSTDTMIAEASVAVTINSQSSFDALLEGKPVVLCGEAYFGDLGFTQTCRHPRDLENAITTALADGMTDDVRNAFNAFFYFLNTRYLVEGTAERLIALLKLQAGLVPGGNSQWN